MVEIKRSNPNAFKQLDLRLKELQSKQAKVGWLESARYENGTPVAYVAAIQELGCAQRSIPPRPTMRPAFFSTQDKVHEIASNGAKQILAGKATSGQIMDTIALVVEAEISRNISTITQPPLSEITIISRKYKKEGTKITGSVIGAIAKLIKDGDQPDVSGISTKPLVDTGLELATLTSVVEDAGAV